MTDTKALVERVRDTAEEWSEARRGFASGAHDDPQAIDQAEARFTAALSELEARMRQDDKLIAAARDLVDAVKSSSDAVSNDLGNAMARMEDILDKRHRA